MVRITLETWTDYVLAHFYAFKMRPVSAFDPSGLYLMTMLITLGFGLILVLIRHCTNPTWARDQIEITRSRMKENLKSMEKNFQQYSKYVTDTAINQSERQGFTVEMLNISYLSRLAFSVVAFAISSYLNALAAVVAGWRTPNVVILDLNEKDSGEKTLPDLGHDLFKFVMSYFYGDTKYIDWFNLPDEFIASVGTITIIFVAVHPKRLLILRRLTAIFAFINLCRACCVAVTSLPDASPQCISQFGSERGLYKGKPIFPKAFLRAWKVLIRPSQHITCGDMIFSGHTVFLVLCAMLLKTYSQHEQANTPFTRRFGFTLVAVRWIVYSGTFCGIFAIIGTRLHYTLDVLIAVYITIQTWITYHWMAVGSIDSFKLMNWLENKHVRTIDLEGYRKARRTSSLDEGSLKKD